MSDGSTSKEIKTPRSSMIREVLTLSGLLTIALTSISTNSWSASIVQSLKNLFQLQFCRQCGVCPPVLRVYIIPFRSGRCQQPEFRFSLLLPSLPQLAFQPRLFLPPLLPLLPLLRRLLAWPYLSRLILLFFLWIKIPLSFSRH